MPPRGLREVVREGFRRTWRLVRGLPWWRFAAGVVAGAAGLGLSLLLRLWGLGVFLPEVAVDFAVSHTPGEIESFFIRTLGGGAKVLALMIAVLVFLAVLGVAATFFRRVQRVVRNRWLVIAVYALGTTAASLLVILPLLGGGFGGDRTPQGPWAAPFGTLLGSFLYASVLDYLLVEMADRHPEGFNPSRRQFLTAGVLALLGLAVAAIGLGSFAARPSRLSFRSVAEMRAKEITPTSEFYTVTKNVIDPDVDIPSWRLVVDGLVALPAVLTRTELLARLPTERVVTLECVSNEVGGNLISTAKWSGIPLADLLTAAQVRPEADWVAFTCADGYTVGVPMRKAMEPTSLLALSMNDAPLTRAHGSPARILVPGVYGMFHAKWVTKITAVQGEFQGFWQQKGWTNRGDIKTTAILATPSADTVVGSPVELGGVAYAGTRGISRVEVSTDGGSTWEAATLKSPPLSGETWVLWTLTWRPSTGGAYRVLVRAVDGTAAAQDQSVASPFPAGSSGYDAVTILVSL